jgi:cold shock CspA family protein
MWNVGFGFIKDETGEPDMFLHAAALRAAAIHPETVRPGVRLACDVEQAPDSKTRAVNVWKP